MPFAPSSFLFLVVSSSATGLQDLFRRQTSWSPGDVASPSAGGVERLVPPTPASPKQGRPDAARAAALAALREPELETEVVRAHHAGEGFWCYTVGGHRLQAARTRTQHMLRRSGPVPGFGAFPKTKRGRISTANVSRSVQS